MGVESIYNNYGGNGIWGTDSSWLGTDYNSSKTSSSSSSAYGTSKTSAQKASYLTSSYSALASAVSSAMDGLGLSSGDKVTFGTLMKYKEQLQEEFSQGVKDDLTKLGVDKDVEFRLVPGKDGRGLQVISDSPDKAKIEKYFKDNPERVKQFETIQALTNMEDVRKNQKIDTQAIRSRIQLESMSAWFSEPPASTNMAFSGGDVAYLNGVNKTV